MSENENPKDHKLAVSTDDFIRFLEAKSLEASCPSCQSQQWTVIGSVDTDTPYRLSTPAKTSLKATNLLTYAIFCVECGFVRNHMARVVKAWVDENPAEQTEMDFGKDDDDVND